MALAVITLEPRAGDAITLWLNCILTITRHRCEERLPGKRWPEDRNWSHKLLKGEHPCLRQGSLRPGRTQPPWTLPKATFLSSKATASLLSAVANAAQGQLAAASGPPAQRSIPGMVRGLVAERTEQRQQLSPKQQLDCRQSPAQPH